MKKRTAFITVLFFALLFLFVQSSYAIYQWVDEKGVLHFSDNPRPTKSQAKQPEDEKPEKTPSGRKAGTPASVHQDQDVKGTPSIKQPQTGQKTVPAAQAPASTQVQKPGTVAPQTPAQPAVTAPAPSAQPQPIMPPQTVQPKTYPNLPPGLSPHDKRAAELQAALMAKYLPMFLIVGALFYCYYCLCAYLIAKKLDVPAAWLAWVPILQIWTFFRSAGKSLLWILPCLIPFVNILVIAYLWICIVENLGKNKWLGLLMLVPIVQLIYLGVLAFSSKET